MTTSTSSTVDEIQQRNATARGRVISAPYGVVEAEHIPDQQYTAAIIEAALMELAQVWTDEAQYFTEQKRRGWKSTAEELTRAAARLRGFAVGLTTRDVQMPPEPDDDPNNRMSVSTLEEALQVPPTDPDPLTVDNFLPEPPPVEHHAGEIVTEFSNSTVSFLTGAPVAVDNPFTSPAAPGSNRPPVKRLGYGELGQLIAETYPVPRPHLSHSFVESTEHCGLSALLSDASRAGHLGPRRPSWSLLGGNAFHLAIESIERTSINIGGTSPLAESDDPAAWQKFWEEVLAQAVDEQKAALIGTAYAQPSTWHVANRGLEGFDWWRVEGLAMIKRYLEFHDNTWRSKHTLLQVPQDPTAAQPQRVPVLEFPFTTTAGSTAITAEGFIDAAWLSTTEEYPTATLEISDYKSGKSVPTEHFQLAEYADVLRRRYLPPGFALPIVGRYWLARQGRYTSPVKLDPAAAQAEIDYRYTMANRKVGAGVFEPSPSNFCASCSSVDYCPAQSVRDA